MNNMCSPVSLKKSNTIKKKLVSSQLVTLLIYPKTSMRIKTWKTIAKIAMQTRLLLKPTSPPITDHCKLCKRRIIQKKEPSIIWNLLNKKALKTKQPSSNPVNQRAKAVIKALNFKVEEVVFLRECKCGIQGI